ncbi:hypothetical protein [Actinophytocola algeriensis]|uniref:Uncharacterized protein n=1 Tax=Actinophytocola algeriensis TaxID=1768010 RepID=A0A7W7QDF8_9PSEU|nr:hypothetical protein [Actinophytocola algeriensis]MBB4911615.1 hypothetical protein [Actinophytocola algeriensis]MBE1473397.1 hypothetical protein [Actinophytocola algeriensis]
MRGLRRRPVLWLAIGAVLVAGTFVAVTFVAVTTADGPDGDRPAPSTDLAEEVRRFAEGLDDDAPYRPPRRDERRQLLSGLRALEAGKPPLAAEDLGFTASTGTDEKTGRPFGLLVNPADERGWGWYLVDRSAPVKLVIEVPHPNSDLHTEEIGLALYRAVPGSILLVAGTHRRADDEAGDVAHRTDSMFHAVARDLAGRDLPQIQLHGFHDDNLPDTDVVISPGAGDDGDFVRRIATRLDAGFRVCRSWQRDCGRLEGRTNEQGRDAARQGTPFAHVEISRTIRDDRDAWSRLVRALAGR